MGRDIDTFDADVTIMDPLYRQQKESVSRMREALLSCNTGDTISLEAAMQSMVAMRVYHQLISVVRYLELMNKLEDRLYASIEYTIDDIDDQDPNTWALLLAIQEKLQKSLEQSHKLLKPYMDISASVSEFTAIDVTPAEVGTKGVLVLAPEKRDRLRQSASAVLSELRAVVND